MKKYLLFIALSCVLFACSDVEYTPPYGYKYERIGYNETASKVPVLSNITPYTDHAQWFGLNTSNELFFFDTIPGVDDWIKFYEQIWIYDDHRLTVADKFRSYIYVYGDTVVMSYPVEYKKQKGEAQEWEIGISQPVTNVYYRHIFYVTNGDVW